MGQYAKIQLVGGLPDNEASRGKRYPLTRLNDSTGKMEKVTSFEDSEDLQEAMSMRDENGNDMYSKDPAYRMTIQEIIANSPGLMAEPTIARRSVIPTNEEFMRGLRHDALIQRRNQLVEAAGGNDAISKLALAEAMSNGEFAAEALELVEATEAPRPYEDYLKSRKAEGLGPVKWSFAIDEDKAITPAGEDVAAKVDADGHIIEIGEQ